MKEVIVRLTSDHIKVKGGQYVQDLVRCKDCKKAHLTYDGDCKYCDEWKDDDDNYITVYHDGNFYCGYGEVRDER